MIAPNINSLNLLADEMEISTSSLKDIYDNSKIVEAVLKSIKDYGIKVGLHKSEIPQKIKLCPEEWTPDNELVTAALEIRRKQIKDFYQQDIDRLYKLD